jgi:glucose/arabinose dehydrogenase/type 1 glutamine amidotransferase
MAREDDSDHATDEESAPIDAPRGRRRVLKGIGALGLGGIAGCLGDGDGNTPTDTLPGDTDTDTPTDTLPRDTDTPTDTPEDTDTPTPTPEPVPDDVGILVVSSTPDYRHESIPAGNEAMKELGARMESETGAESVTVDIIDTEGEYADTEPTTFPTDPTALAKYDVIVFNNANGGTAPDEGPDVLDAEQAAAFETFVRSGRGVVGIHSAIDAQRSDSFYADVMGSYFRAHPAEQQGTMKVTDRVHPSTSHLPEEWNLEAEWYTFTEDPRGDAHVLMSADESSLDDHGDMNPDGHHHPAAWCKEVAGGRSWYTALGHLPEHFQNENVLDHIYGGIMWAAGFAEGDATGTVWDAYETTELTGETESPTMVEVAPDGRVFYIDRRDYNAGNPERIMLLDPGTGETTTALELDVAETRLNGIKGMVLDADFADTGWVYLYYGPAAADIDEDHNRLSRFAFADGTIDPDSEVELLRVPVTHDDVGHIAGDLAWGADGEQLYLSTGDDTNCCISSGYTPIDEREGQANNDAQRTAANTADLRGSLLRIVPNEDGSYDIPGGNLLDTIDGATGSDVSPEIYGMGFRNPYRIAVDADTGVPYVADYGPDAGGWDSSRGPPAITQYLRIDGPGFYGWPYFRGPNIPYRDYDFETGASGDLFDPENPTNDSARNDGLTELPAAREPMITEPRGWEELVNNHPSDWEEHVPWDSYGTDPSTGDVPFPEVTGGAPMQGPVYRHRDDYGAAALSPYFDGKAFIMERGRGWMKYVSLTEDGEPYQVEPFLPDAPIKRPMDLAVGPEGALYLADWGSGYDAPNADSAIYRIAATETTGGGDPEENAGVSVPFGLNAGGEETVTAGGVEFVPTPQDSVEVSGNPEAGSNDMAVGVTGTEDPISGTDNDELYRSLQFGGNLTYEVAIENGTYDVTLYFLENYWGANGETGNRSFDVSVQGETVLSGFDPLEAGGHDIAISRTIENVEVTDGSLTIGTTTLTDNSSVSGIAILEPGKSPPE